MKIGLLSFHNAANYGAAMQAYGLQAFLEKNGYDCEYLDYVNWSRKVEYSMSDHILRCLKKGAFIQACKYAVGTPFMELRKYRFNKFYKKYLKVSPQTYTTAEEAKAWEPLYDKFIVGSDQVWCPENNGSDAAFLLSFVEDGSKKMSYTSSFGVANLPDELRETYIRCLNSFESLSSREQFGVDMIKDLTGRDATLVIDPVFLLTADDWSKLIPNKNTEKYLFSYTNTALQLPLFLRQTNYPLEEKRIYKLSSQTSPADFMDKKVRVMYTMSPQTFLQSIRDAELVVTASFHCMAFCIIFHKPFIALTSGIKTERITNLLHIFGLENRIFTESTELKDVQAPIDWKHVDTVLDSMMKKSATYLFSALAASHVRGVILWINEGLWCCSLKPHVADLVRERSSAA